MFFFKHYAENEAGNVAFFLNYVKPVFANNE